MRRLLLCAALLCGCGGYDPRTALEAARDVQNVSEPCIAAQRLEALEKCDNAECKAQVEAFYAPIRDAFNRFNALWCSITKTEGCDNE